MDAVSKEFEEKMHLFLDHGRIRTARIVCRGMVVGDSEHVEVSLLVLTHHVHRRHLRPVATRLW